MTDGAGQIYERLLILRCQAGDEGALAELMGRYSRGVRFYLRKMSRPEAADDLLQEVWFEVYRKISRLQRPEAFVAWLYRIARDRAYRELRRRPLISAAVEEVADGAGEEEGFGVEDAQRVREALDGLPEDQREVLVLRFMEGMSYEAIGEVVEAPVGTVRSRIHYAKRALRGKLEFLRKEVPS